MFDRDSKMFQKGLNKKGWRKNKGVTLEETMETIFFLCIKQIKMLKTATTKKILNETTFGSANIHISVTFSCNTEKLKNWNNKISINVFILVLFSM